MILISQRLDLKYAIEIMDESGVQHLLNISRMLYMCMMYIVSLYIDMVWGIDKSLEKLIQRKTI